MADTPLTPEEERLLRDNPERGLTVLHGSLNVVLRLLATLDAARQPAPSEGLREDVLRATLRVEMGWSEFEIDQFINEDMPREAAALTRQPARRDPAELGSPSEGPQTTTGRWFRETYGARGYITADDLKNKVRQLAHLTPEDWQERRGADPIARTINAVFDIIDEYSAVQPAPSEDVP